MPRPSQDRTVVVPNSRTKSMENPDAGKSHVSPLGRRDRAQAQGTGARAAGRLQGVHRQRLRRRGVQIAGADTKPARVVGVLDRSELSVETPGRPAKKLKSGEGLWLDAGAAATFVNSSGGGTSRFVLV